MNSLITADAGRLIDGLRVELEPLIIESGKSFDRLRSVFMIAVQQNPDILKCSENSIKREISKCAADGLVPDNKEAAMIPYKGELQYQPMVQGMIKRMKELGGVFNIICNLVHKNDEFVLDEADPDSLSHKSNPFATAEARGPVVGGYVVFRDEQNRVMHLEKMSLEDFERVRRASKAPDSPAWKNWTNEMYKKAVLRRGAKYISVNNDKIRALLERQDELFDFTPNRVVERTNPFTGEVLEGNATPALEHKKQTPMQQPRETQPADRQHEPRQQRNNNTGDGKASRKQERQPENKDAGNNQQTKTETKKDLAPPAVPDVDVFPADKAKVVEAVEKLLGVALLPDLDPPGRRGVLKKSAVDWKEATPDYTHPLLKACIDMSDYAIQQQVKEEAWAGEHAMFVHKIKSLLDVEKLNVGKYP
jgi:phage RecT family recombinase